MPLSSPKPSDYVYVNGVQTVRRSIVPIHRIVIRNGNNIDFFGKLKFSSMIPIPDGEFTLLDVAGLTDLRYKSIIENQIRYIRRNADSLRRNHAMVIYNQKMRGIENIGYLKQTVDFGLLEEQCRNYENIQQSLRGPQEQIATEKEISD